MEKQINIKDYRDYKKDEIFTYNLTVEGHSKAKIIDSDFKMSSVQELTFLDYDKDTNMWRFRLKELSYKLEKYDDSTVVQIIEASNEISKIYQELDIWVNEYGVIKEINNIKEIYAKWEKVREYLTYKYPMSSYEIIRAKEEEITNKELFINNIKYIHFIHFYFMQFGMYDKKGEFNAIDMDRFGARVAFGVNYHYTTENVDGKLNRHFEGVMIPDSEAQSKMAENARDNGASVKYETKADYHNDGVIVEEANFSFTENIGKNYSMYSNLHLILNGYGK